MNARIVVLLVDKHTERQIHTHTHIDTHKMRKKAPMDASELVGAWLAIQCISGATKDTKARVSRAKNVRS